MNNSLASPGGAPASRTSDFVGAHAAALAERRAPRLSWFTTRRVETPEGIVTALCAVVFGERAVYVMRPGTLHDDPAGAVLETLTNDDAEHERGNLLLQRYYRTHAEREWVRQGITTRTEG